MSALLHKTEESLYAVQKAMVAKVLAVLNATTALPTLRSGTLADLWSISEIKVLLSQVKVLLYLHLLFSLE